MSIHRTCVIPRRRCSCGAGLCWAVRLHDLEVGFDGLHCQHLCGNVNPALSLQRYEHHRYSVTLQLCRIYHGLWVCREFFVYFSVSNPNSGIRADLCIVVLVRIEHIEDVGIDFLIVTLLFASVHVHGIVGLQATLQTNLILRWDWFDGWHTTRIVHKWLRQGVSFSSLVDMIFAMEGP
jgi:hypothetical protein